MYLLISQFFLFIYYFNFFFRFLSLQVICFPTHPKFIRVSWRCKSMGFLYFVCCRNLIVHWLRSHYQRISLFIVDTGFWFGICNILRTSAVASIHRAFGFLKMNQILIVWFFIGSVLCPSIGLFRSKIRRGKNWSRMWSIRLRNSASISQVCSQPFCGHYRFFGFFFFFFFFFLSTHIWLLQIMYVRHKQFSDLRVRLSFYVLVD